MQLISLSLRKARENAQSLSDARGIRGALFHFVALLLFSDTTTRHDKTSRRLFVEEQTLLNFRR